MKRQHIAVSILRSLTVVLFVCLVFVVLWAGSPSAEMCGCMPKMGSDTPTPLMDCGMMRGMERRGKMHGAGRMGHGGKMHGMMMHDEHPMWRHLMGLGLDEKQREAMKEIKSKVMKEMIKKRADERAAGIELKDLLDKDPVDIKAVEAKLKEIETVRTEMRLSFIRAREEIKSKLTSEQRKTLKEMPEMGPIMGPPTMDRRHGQFGRRPSPASAQTCVQTA